MLDAEGRINDVRYIVLQHPFQGNVKIWIHGFDIGQVDRLVQQHLVERHREPSVDVMPVKHGNT